MIKVTRNDIYTRDEKGGEWFDEFLRSFADEKEGSIQDVMDAIQSKKGETVQGIVDKYKIMVGIDSVADNDTLSTLESKASFRPISIRHAEHHVPESIVVIIEKDPVVKEGIRSMCEHSGGTKNTHSIMDFIREKLGKDLINYSDENLVKYIEDIKKSYRDEATEESHNDVGRVGIETDDHTEDTADYITHGKGNF